MLGILVFLAFVAKGPSTAGQTPEARFWAWFQAHQSTLLTVVKADEPICDELATELHKIHADLTFEFGPAQKEGRREFVVSADGIRGAFPAVIALTKAASELPRWTIIAFRPARPEVTSVSVSGVHLDARSVEFLAHPRDGMMDLTISVQGYRVTPNKAYEQAVYLLLDRMVGEYKVETGIGSIEIIPPERRPKGEWKQLTRLGEVIKVPPVK